MHVLIVRHAIAEDFETFSLSGQPDELRPLTDKGIAKMRKNIRGLKNVVPQIHLLTSSPLRRAIQTADLLAEAYPEAHRGILPDLAPREATSGILAYLRKHEHTAHVIILVGHEPYLGELATWLLSGHTDTWLPLKKGAACLLEFSAEVNAGQADLRWLLTPVQLRQLAD